MQSYVQRILTRQIIDTSGLTGLLSSIVDATAVNTPGNRIFAADPSGNMVGFVYAQIQSPTALAVGVPMYWTDAAHDTVTDTIAQALFYVASKHSAIQSAAGVCISTATTNGQYAWIQTCGYLSGVANSVIATPASTGDVMVLSNAAGTAPTSDAYTRIGVGTSVTVAEALTTLYLVTVATASPASTVMVMGTCALT